MNVALRKHFRSNVIGYVALFLFAVSSTAQALPGKNQVDSGDIKNRQVKTKDLAFNSVGSPTVINGSLTGADLSPGILKGVTGPVGPKGATGLAGPTGPIGPQGPASGVADGSVKTAALADGSVTTPKLADDAVTTAKLGANAVNSAKVATNSLTTADLEGTDINGVISLGAGAVANGRCEDFAIGVGGAIAGEAVIVSLLEGLPQGIMLYGTRVPSNGTVTLKICNLSGGAMAAITELSIRVITFG